MSAALGHLPLHPCLPEQLVDCQVGALARHHSPSACHCFLLLRQKAAVALRHHAATQVVLMLLVADALTPHGLQSVCAARPGWPPFLIVACLGAVPWQMLVRLRGCRGSHCVVRRLMPSHRSSSQEGPHRPRGCWQRLIPIHHLPAGHVLGQGHPFFVLQSQPA